jgi:uncharacterized protein
MATDIAALPPELQHKLKETVRRIVEAANPQLIILFGSYAEGRQQEGSDVDLLVVTDTASPIRLAVSLGTIIEPVLAPLHFDLLVRTPEAWERGRHLRGFVTRQADRKGVRLYEAA